MKKILLTLLTIFMLVPIIGTLDSIEVKALEQNEMSCGAFEVDYINDDGTFSKVGCYDDLSSAKSKMKENNDYVVRHSKSLSYTKIVAMNSGIAYSYPRWGSTLSIYQNLYNQSIYYKSTYVSRHYEMDYVDTSLVGVGSSDYVYGMIEVNVMGFHGYCDLENSDLVPTKFIRNGIKTYLGGNNSYTGEGFFGIACKQNYFEKDSDGDLVFHMYYGYSSNGYDPQSYTFTIGKASDAMSVGTKYYSYNGYEFYTNRTFTDNKITYYNYYQFLPLRSKTNVSADMLNKYISDKGYTSSSSKLAGAGEYFINAQNKYGINALILFSMAIHESGFGTSGYARNRNNLFGWNAYDSDPNNASYFNSVADCVNEQAGINLRGYVDITDGRFFSSSLGNKGSGLNVKYASDPYWGMKIASYCYAIDSKYNDSKDINTYTLSLINTFDINVYSSASTSSKVLYTTQYGPYYQENFIVINLGDQGNGMTKIQSTNPIDDNGNIKTHRTPITTGELNPISSGEYNYDKSVAYVETKYLSDLNSGKGTDSIPDVPIVTPTKKENKAYSGIDSLELTEEGVLKISGYAFIRGIAFDNADNISFVLNLKNVNDDEIYKSYEATVSEYEGIKFSDGLEYKYVGYSIEIPTKDIIYEKDFSGGVYYLSMDIKNGDTEMSSTLSSSDSKYSNLNYNYGDFTYHISTNSSYLRRVELDIESMPSVIDYESINKKYANIDSLFSYDSLSIDEDGNFSISGQGLIYYSDFKNQEDITYTIYLVNDNLNYVEIPCDTIATPNVAAYKKALKTSYDISYICFEAKDVNLLENLKSTDKEGNELTTLLAGNYSMILKIENGEYVDFVEMSTISSVNQTSGNYRIFKSNVRNRLMLEVKEDVTASTPSTQTNEGE